MCKISAVNDIAESKKCSVIFQRFLQFKEAVSRNFSPTVFSSSWFKLIGPETPELNILKKSTNGKKLKRTVYTFSSTVGDSQFFTHKNKVILILNSSNLHKNPTELYYTVYNVLHKEGIRLSDLHNIFIEIKSSPFSQLHLKILKQIYVHKCFVLFETICPEYKFIKKHKYPYNTQYNIKFNTFSF